MKTTLTLKIRARSRQFVVLTHFRPMFPYLYPLKTPENQRFIQVSTGYRKRLLARNGSCFFFFFENPNTWHKQFNGKAM